MCVLDAAGKCIAVLTSTELMMRLTKGKVTVEDTIAKICVRKFRTMGDKMPLNEMSRVLVRYPFVVVNSRSGKPVAANSATLLQFMTKTKQQKNANVNAEDPVEANCCVLF